MKLYEILRDFEQSITKSGLPEPPKLSHLVDGKSLASPTIKEAAEVEPPNSYPDGMTITPNTKPGWYNIAGKEIYINAFDIPPKVISVGDKRGTVDITPPPPKWRVAESSPSPTETVKTVYSGTNPEIKRTTKPTKWQETLNPSHNTIERR